MHGAIRTGYLLVPFIITLDAYAPRLVFLIRWQKLQRNRKLYQVVPIHYNELQETKIGTPKKQADPAAIRLEYNGIIMAISNDADAAVIKATLTALQRIR